jgi:hypothetical protein
MTVSLLIMAAFRVVMLVNFLGNSVQKVRPSGVRKTKDNEALLAQLSLIVLLKYKCDHIMKK